MSIAAKLFDYFPQNAKFIYIKETNFVPKLSYMSCQSAKVKIYKFEKFEISNNFVDYEVIENRKIKNEIIKNDNGLDKNDMGKEKD